MRYGEDWRLDRDKDGAPRHTLPTVYCEMLLQVCRDYPGLPDVRTLDMDEIRFFYEGLRAELKEATKDRD